MDVQATAADAFAHLGYDTQPMHEGKSGEADLLLEPAGVRQPLHLLYRSLVDEPAAGRLANDADKRSVATVVVSDRVTNAGRALLTARGVGYLDLRGRLVIRRNNLLIDAHLERSASRPKRSNAFAGNVGLEVAAAILMRPYEKLSVRSIARTIGRSPSAVSDVLAALRDDALIDTERTIPPQELFWATAEYWKTPAVDLAAAPDPADPTQALPLKLGLDDVQSQAGWAVAGSSAALAYGAPIAARADQPLDFYVPDDAIARRAVALLGTAPTPASAKAVVRVAPVPAVVRQRVSGAAFGHQSWPLAHPVFVALDLAQDVGRGREILGGWTPPEGWTRVW